uniref:Uncharacterized protein n=1 Tax=Mycolicibacterium neoaurum VKM Ac-1815D TaxID=700508 RepID=V5XJ68_MYCNE
MSHPHIDQTDRDLLDDHALVDHEPAGDDTAADKQNGPREPGVTSTGGSRPNHPNR